MIATFPYDRSELLHVENVSYQRDLEHFLWGAFLSDVADGDRTTPLLSSYDAPFTARVEARQGGVFCGSSELNWLLARCRTLELNVEAVFYYNEGDFFRVGDVVLELKGLASDLLRLERTLLNFLQRMCGIATLTRRYVDQASPIRIAATRKTLYGLLDKYAVSVGGGLTHRLNLGDAPLIKDNHFTLVQDDWEVIVNALQNSPSPFPFVTLEVRQYSDVERLMELRVCDFGFPVFLLCDNFSPEELRDLISRFSCHSRDLYWEASGGIQLDRLKHYLIPGIDVLSIGALTHSAPAIDLSLLICQ